MVFGIRLNNATGAGFVSGSSVEGSVYFDTNKEASANDLVAQLYGEEYVTIKYETKDSSGDYKVSYASRTRPLINLSVSLNASGMIQNGKIVPMLSRSRYSSLRDFLLLFLYITMTPMQKSGTH